MTTQKSTRSMLTRSQKWMTESPEPPPCHHRQSMKPQVKVKSMNHRPAGY